MSLPVNSQDGPEKTGPTDSRSAPPKSNLAAFKGAVPRRARTEELIDTHAAAPGLKGVISITGSSSNAGKTWLSGEMIKFLVENEQKVTALKVTRTHVDRCPRENDTCGTCDSLLSAWRIVEDHSLLNVPRKDTGHYFAAGAHQVLWLLCKPEDMAAGVRAVLAKVQAGTWLVAEGNSFRDFASADMTLMCRSGEYAIKPSAEHIWDYVDAFVDRVDRQKIQEIPRESAAARPVFPSSALASVRRFVMERFAGNFKSKI